MSGPGTWRAGRGRERRPMGWRRRRGGLEADPGRIWQDRVARPMLLWWRQARAVLGIRRGVHVDRVYYKELSPESLQRALSKRGRGFKKYRVTFPDGSKMIIRCSAGCVYADLMGTVGLNRFQRIGGSIWPGMRVLEVGSGSGYRAEWLSRTVGPSGAVVAIEPEPVQAEFAGRRYQRTNVAFERGSLEALAGETDGSFDAVLTLAAPADEAELRPFLAELWRVVAPGGLMFIGVPPDRESTVRQQLEAVAATAGARLDTLSGPGEPRDIVLRKPAADQAEEPP